MKAFAILLLLITYTIFVVAEKVSFMKPLSGAEWVVENIENVEWKYSSDFERDSFTEARVDLMRGDPKSEKKGELVVHIHAEKNFDFSGVAFQLPVIPSGKDYYVRLSIVTGSGAPGEIFTIDSAPITVSDRASTANTKVVKNEKTVVNNAKSDSSVVAVSMMALVGSIVYSLF